MDTADAFASDVTMAEFLLEKLPRLHDERLDVFELYSDATLRFSVYLKDVDRRFSVELSAEGSRAIEGEFIDFPIVTLQGEESNWEFIRDHARRLFEKGEKGLRKHPPPDRISQAFLDEFERFDGTLTVRLVLEDRDEPVEMRLILNDYEPYPGARSIDIRIPMRVAQGVMEGRVDPSDARDGIDVSGDMSLGLDLSGLILEHFPALEN